MTGLMARGYRKIRPERQRQPRRDPRGRLPGARGELRHAGPPTRLRPAELHVDAFRPPRDLHRHPAPARSRATADEMGNLRGVELPDDRSIEYLVDGATAAWRSAWTARSCGGSSISPRCQWPGCIRVAPRRRHAHAGSDHTGRPHLPHRHQSSRQPCRVVDIDIGDSAAHDARELAPRAGATGSRGHGCGAGESPRRGRRDGR